MKLNTLSLSNVVCGVKGIRHVQSLQNWKYRHECWIWLKEWMWQWQQLPGSDLEKVSMSKRFLQQREKRWENTVRASFFQILHGFENNNIQYTVWSTSCGSHTDCTMLLPHTSLSDMNMSRTVSRQTAPTLQLPPENLRDNPKYAALPTLTATSRGQVIAKSLLETANKIW